MLPDKATTLPLSMNSSHSPRQWIHTVWLVQPPLPFSWSVNDHAPYFIEEFFHHHQCYHPPGLTAMSTLPHYH